MKGQTICPKCQHKFILDLKDIDDKIHEVVCPKCKNKYNIKTKHSKESKQECNWEEHGEPRKTILSKNKTKTNKPMIATIFLVCVFVIGITSAVFSEQFIDSTFDIGSAIGLEGKISIDVSDYDNSISDVFVTINNITKSTNENGTAYFEKVELGIQEIELSKTDYKKQVIEALIFPFISNNVEVTIEKGTGENEKNEFNKIGCSLITVIFSIFALISIIACIRRRNFDLALAGSAVSILSIGFFFTCLLLAIIALYFIYRSRYEFENGKKGKTF